MTAAGPPPPPTPERQPAAEVLEVHQPRTRFVVIGTCYALLGAGLVDLARRVPDADVTFTFGIPPEAAGVTFDPPGVVALIGALLLAAGIAGILERRSGRWAGLSLGLVTALLPLLVLVLALAYSDAGRTNLIPIVGEALVQTTPIALGVLAGLWSERSGVVNIGIEGMMLAAAGGGFVAYAVLGAGRGGVPLWLSVLVAVGVGMAMAALHAVLTVSFRTDQIISGVVINLLALGLTSYLRQQIIVPLGIGNALTLPEFQLPGVAAIPIIGPLFEGGPIFFSMFVLYLGTAWVLFSTPFGLRVRSVGENPHAAETLGLNPIRIRYTAVILGGAMAGLGGAWFSLEDVGSFEDNMTNGVGFIALAALIFGKHRPWPAFAGALLFGSARAFGIRLQILDVRLEDFSFLGLGFPEFEIPSQLLQALPFIVTIIVLAGAIGRAVPPAAIGQPYQRSR